MTLPSSRKESFVCKECGAIYSSEDILQVHLFAHTKYRREYEKRQESLSKNAKEHVDHSSRNILLVMVACVVGMAILVTSIAYDQMITQQHLTDAVNSHNCQSIKSFGQDMLKKGNVVMSDQATNAFKLEGCS